VTTADGRRILITGIAGLLARRLARRLQADPAVEYIAGLDLREPADLDGVDFVRADLRNPLVGRVLESTGVDTVVHLAITAEPGQAGGRARMKELNVIGTMQLLGAAQRSPHLRRLVVKSTTAVYGSSYADPALFREDSAPDNAPRSGYAKDAVEVEGYARGFGRRRGDATLTILRFANFIGPEVDSPLTRYFQLPAVPVVFGFDPRVQLVHVDDAVTVLERAVLEDHPGIYNVAGQGILYLSQAVHMAGRPTVPVPLPLVDPLAGLARRLAGLDVSPDQLRFLLYGRVGDITRLRTVFGYEPAYDTLGAFREFLEQRVTPVVEDDVLDRLEADLGSALTRARAVLRGGAS
jgi:UDP-glucose 4-epimerase